VVGLLDRLSYRTLQWLVAGFALLHNLEEGLTMPGYATVVRERLSSIAPTHLLAATEHLSWFYAGLLVATFVPALIVLAATSARPSRGAAWAVVFVQSVFLVNVFVPHVPAAVMLGGYAPGVVTAVCINLPYSLYFMRRSVREGTVSSTGVAWAIGLAVPVLVVSLALLYVIAGKKAM
jgi:hypothetical protein